MGSGAVEGGMKCVKYLLFGFNLLFFLSGIALIVIGALVHVKYNQYSAAAQVDFVALAYLFIAVGCIVFVITFFACCGAIKENNCMSFECCGAVNYTDWAMNSFYKDNTDVPDSCCKPVADAEGYLDGCGKGQRANATNIYTIGCADGMQNWFVDNIVLIGGIGIGIAFIQILGIVLACCLGRGIRKEYEVV
ncbi:PREDICTED: CD63 antigen-like [Priapulus caudatus]|uniref:Tetraspanin n=1 Tax=Priapulus caudatus TaxID=37621 RepID=A0ABM1F5G8_PRICU|nr:PREDICTED: CD63 antigen-like [Priapulus caudatus]